MGSDNFIKWHRQHCPEWSGHDKTKCASCNGIAYLDKQLEGLDEPAYFEDYHYGNCWLKNCIYCKGFANLVMRVEQDNAKLKEDDHHYSHVDDQPDGWRVEACKNVNCRATIKKRGVLEKMGPVAWWSKS